MRALVVEVGHHVGETLELGLTLEGLELELVILLGELIVRLGLSGHVRSESFDLGHQKISLPGVFLQTTGLRELARVGRISDFSPKTFDLTFEPLILLQKLVVSPNVGGTFAKLGLKLVDLDLELRVFGG